MEYQIGHFQVIEGKEDLDAAMSMAGTDGIVVVDPRDWQIIPAENLVAAYQPEAQTQLLATVNDAAAARVMLESLEIGTDGVVLRTNDSNVVRELVRYREGLLQGDALTLEVAEVVRVVPVGMGDRACTDFCSMLSHDEGLLLGNFARALFLVASESGESQYIASRPFRVNAGPVHAYTLVPGGKTKYLSELSAGDEVVTVDAQGRQRTAVVGRMKIERRPLVLVEAQTADGRNHSIILQNAETVKLLSAEKLPLSVADIKGGDHVLVHLQAEARHTGMEIEEQILER